MIEHNAFCNSEPQEDALCGCVDNYDLTDWNAKHEKKKD